MIFKKNKANSLSAATVAGKIIIACFLLCCSSSVSAQYEQDSVTVTEEVVMDTVVYDDNKTADDEEEEDDKEYFLQKNVYSGDSVLLHRHKVPDSLVKKMQEDDDFWYANAVIEKEKKKEQEKPSSYTPLGQRTWFKTLIWLIIIGSFAAVLILYLTGSNVGLFRKKSKLVTANDDEEAITEDIFAINYQKEIDKATAQGNYRLAVRLMFLRLLKNMSEKNIIQYKQDRTNFDYLLQLHPTKYYNSFFRITRNYEYSWYGQFEVREEAYRIIRNDFDQLENTLR